ncbi:hypothetical protein C8J57DRAFT_1250477 [Mycena rebaudengoi]|nr:hypothetical protein C8J57DRAFT_1254712 [Mycena rebaudengoi]KAJ7232755.1 hypothetical protein C8J57DRAFT_1250477 [Mycena rebaudengoi]
MSHPMWVHPSSALFLCTEKIPTLLYPYGNAFRDNLATLMHDCGFAKVLAANNTTFISVQISRSTSPSSSAWRPSHPLRPEFCLWRTNFRVWEEKESGENFSATAFGRILTHARRDDPTGNDTSTPSASNKRRRPSHAVKEENENKGPRLRSVTRASPAATLRSTPGNVRRSGRKRVKTEE